MDPSTHLPHGLLYGRNNISDPLDLALPTKESRLSVGTYLIIVDVIEELNIGCLPTLAALLLTIAMDILPEDDHCPCLKARHMPRG